MNWIPITTTDLNDAKVAALVDALRTAALGDGQDDPSPEVIASVVSRIRVEVSRKNRTDADETRIPKSLKSLAVRMILAALKNRLEMPLTEDERRQEDRDERYLLRIAKGEVPVETPETPTTPQVESNAGVTLASKSSRRMNRSQLEGL
jgi:hypothetical protein